MRETQEWPVFTAEDIEAIKSRDDRFMAVAKAIALENDLSGNQAVKVLMTAVREDAEEAFNDLPNLNPGDYAAVSLALVKIRTLVYIRRVLNIILQRGVVAEQAIRAEDQMEQRDE